MVGALFKHLKLKVYITCMCIHFGGKFWRAKFLRAFGNVKCINIGAKLALNFKIKNTNNFVHEGVM
jgi:hypothetical protein